MQDVHGCIGVAGPIVIAQAAKVSATLTGTAASGCNGSLNGKITITNPIGSSPFQYKLGSFGTFTSFTAPFDITGLRAGNYNVYIKDANGCIGSAGSVSVPSTIFTVNYTKTDLTCINQTGSISLSVQGYPNATFRITGSNTFTSQSNFTGLAAGTYYGYAQDAGGCADRVGPIVLSPASGCSKVFAKGTLPTRETSGDGLQISLTPNPSQNVFTLVVNSKNMQQPVSIKVIDAAGRNMYATKGLPAQAFHIGEKLFPGLYLVEITQGNEMKTVKAIKIK